MKNLMKLTLVVALMMCGFSASAQQKFGYINSQELIASMPESDSMRVKMEAYTEELRGMLESIQVEFNNKLNDLQKAEGTLTEPVRQMKEKELTDLQKRFQEFQAQADQDIQKEQAKLMQPIITKAQDAIKNVCKANNIITAFDLASGALAYHDESAMTNLLPLVQKELGITPKK